MKIQCPRGHKIGLFTDRCPKCKREISGVYVLKQLAGKIKDGWPMKCPECQRSFPIGYERCPHCSQPNTIENILDTALFPFTDRLDHFLQNTPPKAKRFIQNGYLFFSFVAFACSFIPAADIDTGMLGSIIMLSSVFVAGFSLLVYWLIPREYLFAFVAGTTSGVKLAVIFNYLTSLIFLQFMIAVRWQQFAVLAGLIGATWLGAYLFSRYIWPMTEEYKYIFFNETTTIFNLMDNQGRKGRNE